MPLKRDRKILVVGGNGYIGSRLVERLLSAAADVTAVDSFLRADPPRNAAYPIVESTYQNLAQDFLDRFDDCVWLAGHSSVPQAVNDPAGALKNNFLDLIEFHARFKGRLIYASSGSAYSREKPEECSEDSFLANPTNIYDYTKTAFDLYLTSQRLQAVCLRFGTVNGPSSRFRGELMLNKMTGDALSKGIITVRNARAWRPVLFIDDLMRALIAVLESDCLSGIYNLCSVNMSIGEYAYAVARRTKTKIEVLDDTSTYNFIMSAQKFSDEYRFEFTKDVYHIINAIVDFDRMRSIAS
jgi:nucleoside-diphosphate-sugar epimerase